MRKSEKAIKRITEELLLLSLYLVILKLLGWLSRGWLFAIAPLLIVAAAKTGAFFILLTSYLSERHGKKTGNQ